MKAIYKLVLLYPLFGWRNFRARRLAKKANRDDMEERYPVQWRNDLVIKRCNQALKMIGVKIEVEGYENIPKQPSIIVPNHASALDPVVILAALKNPGQTPDDLNHRALFIAKEEMKKNKRFYGYAALINTFFIKRNNPRQALKVFNEAIEEAKKSKRHLIVFPEGTRSKDGYMQEFKGGAFRMAKQGYLPILPVTINNSFGATNLSRTKKVTVKVIFHVPIRPLNFMASDNKGIAARVQKVVQSKWTKPEGKKSKTEAKLA